MDALVHGIEVNDRHGAGVLLKRLFPDNGNFLVVRSRALYGGESEFGSKEIYLGNRFVPRSETAGRFAAAGHGVKRILCVPYFPEDFRAALLLKAATGARLCTYLMDDQNVYVRDVGDAPVRRLLEASDVRFAVSPQMASVYSKKFGLPFYWLPPVVNPSASASPKIALGDDRRAALLGNFWSMGQLVAFRDVVKASGWEIDWFGAGPKASWLSCSADELARDGIRVCGFLDEARLVSRIRACGVAVVPGGTLESDDDKMSFCALSLPSRVVFLLAQARVPVVVLGDPRSAAAKFVVEVDGGTVTPYDGSRLADALAASKSKGLSETALAAGESMVLDEGGEWIWKSLEAGRPADDRFERLRSAALDAPPLPFVPEFRRPTVRRSGFASRWLRPDPVAWRYSQKSQLPWIRRRAPLPAAGHHTFLPSAYQRALACATIGKLVRPGSRVLVLDGVAADLRPVAGRFEVASDPGAGPFAAVASFDRTGSASKMELDRLAEPEAPQLHFWTAYMAPWYFVAPDPALALLAEIDDRDEIADAIADDPSFLYMSAKAAATYWPKRSPYELARAGRPFSLNVCWLTPE